MRRSGPPGALQDDGASSVAPPAPSYPLSAFPDDSCSVAALSLSSGPAATHATGGHGATLRRSADAGHARALAAPQQPAVDVAGARRPVDLSTQPLLLPKKVVYAPPANLSEKDKVRTRFWGGLGRTRG